MRTSFVDSLVEGRCTSTSQRRFTETYLIRFACQGEGISSPRSPCGVRKQTIVMTITWCQAWATAESETVCLLEPSGAKATTP